MVWDGLSLIFDPVWVIAPAHPNSIADFGSFTLIAGIILFNVFLIPYFIYSFFFKMKTLNHIWNIWPTALDPWLSNVVQIGKDSHYNYYCNSELNIIIGEHIHRIWENIKAVFRLIKRNINKYLLHKLQLKPPDYYNVSELIILVKKHIKDIREHSWSIYLIIKNNLIRWLIQKKKLYSPASLEPSDPTYWSPNGSSYESFLNVAIIDFFSNEETEDFGTFISFKNPFIKWVLFWCCPVWSSLLFITFTPILLRLVFPCNTIITKGVLHTQIFIWYSLVYIFGWVELNRLKKWGKKSAELNSRYLPPQVQHCISEISYLSDTIERKFVKTILVLSVAILGVINMLLSKLLLI